MQPVDFTTLMAACAELQTDWLPARLEQVYQRDRHTIALALRTLDQRAWLTLSWHPQAARICIGDPPPRVPDTFTYSQQLQHQLKGLALVSIEAIAPWERALDLQFARRPGEAALWHLYVEIMGKYSNVILTNQDNLIVTAAHQVSSQQSSVRPIQTGQPYEVPPALTDPAPSLSESQERWRERIGLVPGALKRNVLKNYRGLSSTLIASMVLAAGLDPDQSTDSLSDRHWQQLFDCWQTWLQTLEQQQFQPGWLTQGYTVMGWGTVAPVKTVQDLLNRYYTDQLNQQEFSQLRHQISQKLSNILKKLTVKAQDFQARLQQSDQADDYREQADLLMAHLHEWKPGMKAIALADFTTGKPVTIPLNPEKNAVQNAQALYKRHQKLKRSRAALIPLLEAVQSEIAYLEQVEVAISQPEQYQVPDDLLSLGEIRDELIQQNYLEVRDRRSSAPPSTDFRRQQTPGGHEILIGRNNRQNDQLTFRLAGDYDLWFHAQEIPGSHVLLRLQAGDIPDEADLQFTADLAAYYSRARQSEQVPVIYTEPKHVYKPKGAKPGIAIYKNERVIWGQPQRVK
ncbi:MAG: fibronectin-binding domain-containing protein [Leptolyngbyaceae cyanobacterium SL_5_9]|nr:fibronectin-binding domain-containing protein [Leptolyngbyaceae cyanobacterium SL_5_9]NJO73242.1 fibronectin-binding domain-containing protein [Leptolyngbyaceae cyanobacterium RM1_406_9]